MAQITKEILLDAVKKAMKAEFTLTAPEPARKKARGKQTAPAEASAPAWTPKQERNPGPRAFLLATRTPEELFPTGTTRLFSIEAMRDYSARLENAGFIVSIHTWTPAGWVPINRDGQPTGEPVKPHHAFKGTAPTLISPAKRGIQRGLF